MHNFINSLPIARQYETFLSGTYSKAFHYVNWEYEENLSNQYKGIDRYLFMATGTISVEEKIRPTGNYSDVFIEYQSGDRLGWVHYGYECNWIVYAVVERRTSYFIRPKELTRVWNLHGEQWKQQFGIRGARNDRYTTFGCPVPTVELKRVLGDNIRKVTL